MISRIRSFTKSFGPGFITAALILGPGSITVSSSIGSSFGYTLLWLIVVAAICMTVYVTMGARYGVMHKKSILSAIAGNYGRWLSVLIGISAFLSSASFQFGNNLGIGIGMEELTGINERIWPVIFMLLAIVLIYWAKDLYKILEKLMMILVVTMILAFVINLFFIRPNGLDIVKGFNPLTFSHVYLDRMTALVATTFSLTGGLYQAYLVQYKGWGQDNLKKGVRDANIGVFMLALISALILITSAASLHPYGIEVHSAADMARQLETLFGGTAKYIFSIGLCAAAFSSLVVNPVIGAGLLADSLGWGKTMNEKGPKIIAVFVLFLGMLVAVFFRGDIIYALIIAQSATMMGVPLIAIGMFLLLNNKKIMGEYRNTKLQNIIALFGFILINIMVFFMYEKIVTLIGEI